MTQTRFTSSAPVRINAVRAVVRIPDQIISLLTRRPTILQRLAPAHLPVLVFFVSPVAVAVSSVGMAVSAASGVSMKETEP